MKKVLYVFLGLIGLLIIAALAIPVIYRDEIRAKVDREIANHVDADVYFDSFSLSLFRNFPNITVQMRDFGVVGRHEFKGDTLAAIQNFELVVNTMSVIRSEKMQINKVRLDEPRILAKVLSNGKANWDIFVEDTTATDPTAEPTEFNLAVKHWEINNGFVHYYDNTMPLFVRVAGLNHSGSGDFTQDVFDITTRTTAEAFTYEQDTITYISNARLAADMAINMNLPESRYTFQENTVRLNDFAFGFDGFVAMQGDDIEMDLVYKARETRFKNLLSLIPAVFTQDYDKIQTDGTIAFEGFAKGIMTDSLLPAFGLDLRVVNGMLKYPNLPNAISNIALDMNVDNRSGVVDNTVVHVKNFHMDMGKNPVDARVLLKGLTNPDVDARVVARVNLGELTKAFPLEGMNLRGLYSLNLDAKGIYNDSLNLMPAIKANMSMMDGYVKTDDFPSAIENLNFNAVVNNETGKMQDGRLNISNFNMTMDGEPFEAVAYVENFDDINYDVKLKGIIDLTKMTKIYPLEDMTLAGRINADIQTKGKMSDVEAERYDRLPTSGTMKISELVYSSKDMPQGLRITTADMEFNPRNMQITNYQGFLGKSDIALDGAVSNYIGYLFKDHTLKGNMNLRSTRFNVNEWMTDDGEVKEDEPMEVLEIPRNIDFTLSSNINEVVYDNMTMNNLTGNVIVRNGTVALDKVNFNTLGGAIAMNGLYDSRDLVAPKFDFDMDINQVAISEAYKTFNTIRVMAPVAEKMTGNFSSDFRLAGILDQGMKPVMNTLSGGGLIKIAEASVRNLDVLSKMSSMVRVNIPSDLQLRDIALKAQIMDGRAHFEPFDINVAGHKLTIGGSNGLDGSLDYRSVLAVPAGAAGEAVNNAIAGLLGSAPAANAQTINLDFKVAGTYANPQVSLLGSSATDNAKATVKEAVQSRVADTKDQAKEEADRLRLEAEEKARLEADRVKQEAENRAREEAEKAKLDAQKRAQEEADKLRKRIGLPF